MPHEVKRPTEHVGDAVSFGFVDGGAHVLPFLASGLPFVGIDDHFRTDVKRIPSGFGEFGSLRFVHTVEHGRPRMPCAECCEINEIIRIFAGISEWSGHGQCDAVRHSIGDRGTSGCGKPIVIAFPSSHERHGFAAKRNDFINAMT